MIKLPISAVIDWFISGGEGVGMRREAEQVESEETTAGHPSSFHVICFHSVTCQRDKKKKETTTESGGRRAPLTCPIHFACWTTAKKVPDTRTIFFQKKKYFLFLKNKMRHPKTSHQPVVFHQVWQESESISRLDVNGLLNNRFITCQFLASNGLWHPFLDLFDRFIKPVVIQTDGHQDASQMDDHRKLCSNPVAGTCTGYLTELNNFPLKFNFNENSFRTKPPHFGSFSPGTHKLCSFSRVSVDGLQCGGVDLSMSCQWPPVLSPTAALPKWLCFGHFIPRHYLHIYHTHRHPESAVGCLFSTQFF